MPASSQFPLTAVVGGKELPRSTYYSLIDSVFSRQGSAELALLWHAVKTGVFQANPRMFTELHGYFLVSFLAEFSFGFVLDTSKMLRDVPSSQGTVLLADGRQISLKEYGNFMLHYSSARDELLLDAMLYYRARERLETGFALLAQNELTQVPAAAIFLANCGVRFDWVIPPLAMVQVHDKLMLIEDYRVALKIIQDTPELHSCEHPESADLRDYGLPNDWRIRNTLWQMRNFKHKAEL